MSKRFYNDDGNSDRPFPDTPSTNGRLNASSSGAAILLIDDNPAVARAMDIAFRIAGHRIDIASGPDEAWSRLARNRYDAILLDMNFTAGATDGEEGLACLRRITTDDPAACVVVITAHSGIRIAVAAMQAGARDFVMKPWRNAELVAKVEAAIVRSRAALPIVRAQGEVAETPAVLIGESSVMHDLRALIRRVGPTAASVTVTGLAGSGRTLAARAIHAASPNASASVARIDLRGDDRWDRLADAEGTVILRHADQLNQLTQEVLLEHLPPAMRCIAIAATTEQFIPALRHRLATLEIPVPPLAQRGNDAVLLARHFASVAADRFGRPKAYLTPAAEAALQTGTWADEVRGLALLIERAVMLTDDGVIDAASLGPSATDATSPVVSETNFDLTGTERTVIEAALREHRHNVTHAAAALGLSRGALYRRMARYGL